ncbi:glycoside hydrolase family 26 protein [Marinactinospora thermotolerans]|uniref:glycoside hydrolase family 26 protein n=1 Tax=Marinactinospora thermotolerans TaxID=531310 RepID=UPI00373FD727
MTLFVTSCGDYTIRPANVHDDPSDSPTYEPSTTIGGHDAPSPTPSHPAFSLPPGYGTPSPRPSTVPSPGTDPDCRVDEILEPSCGVWWGASPWRGNVYPLEEASGRRMDIVYTWHGVDQHELPNERERHLAAEGRFIHANVEARRFTRKGHPAVDYSDIIEGRFDDSLRSQARGVAELGAPVFITFDHEADANRRYNKRGTPREFVQAWRHIVDLYRDNGADNAIFVWNVTGWPHNFDRLPGLWPGNDYVDWISWEAYNMTGCELQPRWDHVLSFEEALAPMYEWVQTEGERHGIDPDKPVMIGEAGTVPIPGDPDATAQWYAEIPETLTKYERVRAVQIWDDMTAPTCDFRVLKNEAAREGFVEASRHDYLNIPDEAREAILEALELVDKLKGIGDDPRQERD